MSDDTLDNDNTSSPLLGDSQALFNHTQNLRLRIVKGLMGEDLKSTPICTKEQTNLIRALGEIDKQEIAKARLDLDTKTANDEAAYRQRAVALMDIIGNQNPYLMDPDVTPPPRDMDVELPEDALEPLNDGVLETGEVPVSFDEVMAKK